MEKTKTNFKEIHFIYEQDPSKLGFSIKLSNWDMETGEKKIDDFMALVKEEAEKNEIKKIKNIKDLYNNKYDNPNSKFYQSIKEDPLSIIANMCPFTFDYEKEITVSNSDSVESIINLNGEKDITVKQFKEIYLSKPEVTLYYGEKILKDSDKLSLYMKTFTADRVLKIEKQNKNIIQAIDIKICIRDINKVEEFKVTSIDTILSIKKKLLERLEVENSKINLSLKYKDQILEDTKQLNFYGIKTNTDLTLDIKQSGNKEAGISFNDITKNNFKMIKLVSTGPDWLIVCKGLNIEGICENAKCIAYNKKVVCPMIEYELFDLICHSDLIKCPMCKLNFDAKTCGFYDCTYSFNGTKYENNKQIKVADQTFQKVEKDYKHFIYKESDLIKWKRLVIIVKFEDQPEIFCGVCKKTKDEKLEKKECNHYYHDSCYRDINYSCKF